MHGRPSRTQPQSPNCTLGTNIIVVHKIYQSKLYRSVIYMLRLFSSRVIGHSYSYKFLVLSLSGDKQPRYKQFPTVGAFSLKFSIAPTGETKDRDQKKLGGCKYGTDLLHHYAKYGGARGSRAGCRLKSVMFFLSVCLSRFWNDEVCDNGNAMKQCNFQNSYGVIA